MDPLDSLLREFVSPTLREAGFTRIGRTYRRTSALGDHAVLNVWPIPLNASMVTFGVDMAAIPAAYWAWVTRHQPGVHLPKHDDGLANYQLRPPREAAYLPPYDPNMGAVAYAHLAKFGLARKEVTLADSEANALAIAEWGFSSDGDGRTCGQALEEVLRGWAVPKLVRLLDRECLLAEIRQPQDPAGQNFFPGLSSVVCRQIVVLVDGGSITEVERLLGEVEVSDFGRNFTQWARDRPTLIPISSGSDADRA